MIEKKGERKKKFREHRTVHQFALLLSVLAASTTRNRDASFDQFSVSVGALGTRNRFSGIDARPRGSG